MEVFLAPSIQVESVTNMAGNASTTYVMGLFFLNFLIELIKCA